MDIVVAIPMANRKTLPAVNHEKQWIDGTLDYITDAGVPGGVITNLIAPEFPHSIRGLLARKSVSLWRSKIAVKPILDVVGLEWLCPKLSEYSVTLISNAMIWSWDVRDLRSGFRA